MPINAYGGGTGSGKTYQVVRYVIIPQLAKGRMVMTTIRGVKYDKIVEHLIEVEGVERDKIGKLEVIAGALVRKPNFFPAYDEQSETFDDTESVVKLGTLLIIDEALRYYGSGEKVTPRVRQYFNEHRHAVNPANQQSSDVVLLTPDLTQLSRFVRGLLDYSFVCRKHREIDGLNSYVVAMFQGKTLRNPMSTNVNKYDPLYFDFYESYAGGTPGQETNVDERQQAFSKRKIITIILILSLVTMFAAGKIKSAMTNTAKPVDSTAKANDAKQQTNAPGQPATPAVLSQAKPPQFSQHYRLAGYVGAPGNGYAYVQDQENGGRVRPVRLPPEFYAVDGHAVLHVDGEVVTDFSGLLPVAPDKTNSQPSGARLPDAPRFH